MQSLGDNCKYCLCASCANLESCGTMEGNTEWYCENDCVGEDGCMTDCSEYDRKFPSNCNGD